MQARAARITRTGGPEVIEWIDVDLPAPGPGEVLVRNTAVGLNYIDTYFRSGLYPTELPGGLGSEAAGVRADHVLNHRAEDIAARVREITDGRGVNVVFDGVGRATWDISLKATARRGMVVSYGNASGAVSGVNLGALAGHGSLFVTRPTLFDYYATPEDRARGFDALFDMVRSGAIRAEIGQEFALEDAAEAHRALEAGETRGSTILLP